MKAPVNYPPIVQELLDAAGPALDDGWTGFVESDFAVGDVAMAVDDTLQAIVLADQTLPADLIDRIREEFAVTVDGITEQEAERIAGWLTRIPAAVTA